MATHYSEAQADLQSLSIDQLRAVIAPFRDHKAKPFQNWARSVKCHPQAVYKPETEEQIRHLVELARREGTELRAYGAGHSPSDLVCTDGYLLSLDNMKKVLNVDKQRKRMSFQAGILLREVHPIARKEGLAISSLGSISEQSLGGVLSTAVHGVGLKYPTLSGMTTGITLIKADTTIVNCSAEENADLFHATLCGLGCTGIITQVTLQLEPDFRLKEEIFAMDHQDFIESLETNRDGGEHGLLGSAEHVRCWFFPYNNYVKISRLNRTTEPTSKSPSFIERWFNQFIVANYVNQLGLFISRYIPSVLKLHEQMMWHLTHNPHRLPQNQATESKFRWNRLGAPVYSVAPSNEIFNYDCGPRQYTFEGCVPIVRLEECLRALDMWFKDEQKSPNGLQHHFPMEIRPVEQDDVWLSPAYKCRVVYLGIQIYKPFGFVVPHDELFQRFETILGDHGGRPHWAKAHNYSPEKLNTIYPKFKDFLALREQVDPTKVFVNHYLRRHLLGLEVGLRKFTIE